MAMHASIRRCVYDDWTVADNFTYKIATATKENGCGILVIICINTVLTFLNEVRITNVLKDESLRSYDAQYIFTLPVPFSLNLSD